MAFIPGVKTTSTATQNGLSYLYNNWWLITVIAIILTVIVLIIFIIMLKNGGEPVVSDIKEKVGLDNNEGKDDDKQDDEENDTSCDTESPNDQQHNGIEPCLQEEPVIENPAIEKIHAADESSGQPKVKQPHNNDKEPIILPAVTGSVTSCTNATPIAEFPNSNINMLHEGAKTLTDIASIKPADKAIKDGIITGPELEAPTDREVTEIEKADPKMLASIPLDELYIVTPILNTEPELNNNSMWAISQYTSNYSLAATSPLYNTHNSNNITTELSEEASDIK